MKCIIIQTSPERVNAEPVTNEDGTPYIYATMSEARAELKANGYIYNRENQRYYIKGTEYRAYIIREDSEEYAHAITTAEEPEQTAAEIIAELASDPAARRMYLAHATAHQWTPEETRANIEHANQIKAANRAALALLGAYAEAIGEYPEPDDPETAAAYLVARDDLTGSSTRADEHDRATVDAMVEAIADRAREAAAFEANQAANDAIADANRAYSEMENRSDNENWQGWAAQFIEQAQQSAAEAARLAVAANDQTITAKAGAVSAMIRRVREEIAAAAPTYQRAELLAYLGEPDDYDVEAIEAEATRYTADGARVWAAFGSDLAAIAECHELYTYAPAI